MQKAQQEKIQVGSLCLSVDQLDQIDDSLWCLIQLIARQAGIRNLSNDEYNNEMIADVRHLILKDLGIIADWRRKDG